MGVGVDDPAGSVLVRLVLSLLQLGKVAANCPGGSDVLGKNSPNRHTVFTIDV